MHKQHLWLQTIETKTIMNWMEGLLRVSDFTHA